VHAIGRKTKGGGESSSQLPNHQAGGGGVPSNAGLISIVLPVYNGARYIASAISSLLSQSENIEIVISDDASTDNTIDIIRSFDDPRIKLIINTTRGGIFVNLDRGIAAARGTFIQFFSQDDVAHPGFIASQLRGFDLPDIGLVYSSCKIIDEVERITSICDDDGTPLVIDFPTYLKISAKYGALPPSISCVMVRRSITEVVGPFDPTYQVAGDLEFYNRVAERFSFARNRSLTLDVRDHDGSATRNPASALRYMREETRILPYYRRHLGESGYAEMMAYRCRHGRGRDHGRYLLKSILRGEWRIFAAGYAALSQVHRPEACMWNALKPRAWN
jgi:glycosyltransferase involved in cell wall biosynthesis